MTRAIPANGHVRQARSRVHGVRDLEVAPVHAALVTRHGMNVAITGGPAAGKTTALVGLMDQGWRGLAAEWLYLQSDGSTMPGGHAVRLRPAHVIASRSARELAAGRRRLAPMFAAARVDRAIEILERMPLVGFLAARVGERFRRGLRSRAYVDARLAHPTADRIPLHAIIFLEAGNADTITRQLSQSEAMERLIEAFRTEVAAVASAAARAKRHDQHRQMPASAPDLVRYRALLLLHLRDVPAWVVRRSASDGPRQLADAITGLVHGR